MSKIFIFLSILLSVAAGHSARANSTAEEASPKLLECKDIEGYGFVVEVYAGPTTEKPTVAMVSLRGRNIGQAVFLPDDQNNFVNTPAKINFDSSHNGTVVTVDAIGYKKGSNLSGTMLLRVNGMYAHVFSVCSNSPKVLARNIAK